MGIGRQPVNIASREPAKPLSVVDELDYLLPYTDQDFEEWRDVIMPQLEGAYSTALLKASRHARSLQLRSEASRLLEENLVLPSTPSMSGTQGATPEEGKRLPVEAKLPEHFLTCTDTEFAKSQTEMVRQLQIAPLSALFKISRCARSLQVRSEASRLLEERCPPLPPGTSVPQPSPAIAQNRIPPQFAMVRHVHKVQADGKWVLTTKRGVQIAAFDSEAELDRCWREFQGQQRGN